MVVDGCWDELVDVLPVMLVMVVAVVVVTVLAMQDDNGGG